MVVPSWLGQRHLCRLHLHRSLPQSSSALRFTAGAAGFFRLSQAATCRLASLRSWASRTMQATCLKRRRKSSERLSPHSQHVRLCLKPSFEPCPSFGDPRTQRTPHSAQLARRSGMRARLAGYRTGISRVDTSTEDGHQSKLQVLASVESTTPCHRQWRAFEDRCLS
jgi:hypothetical protein